MNEQIRTFETAEPQNSPASFTPGSSPALEWSHESLEATLAAEAAPLWLVGRATCSHSGGFGPLLGMGLLSVVAATRPKGQRAK